MLSQRAFCFFFFILFHFHSVLAAKLFLFVPQECSDLKDEDVLVLPLDLLERTSHEEKTKAAVRYFGHVRPPQLLFYKTMYNADSSLL